MCQVPVFYATTDGHTRRIAERVAEQIRKHGLGSEALSLITEEAAHVPWEGVCGAVVAASVHIGEHQPEAGAFARVHRCELSAIPSLFISVSLAAASVNAEEKRAARQIADKFCESNGWQPSRIASVAGRLAYTQYNWLVRMFMRRIAKEEGAAMDTTRDHEYTDWQQVERLADDLAYQVRRREIFGNNDGWLMQMAS